MMCAANHCKQS